jgi:intracellular sulfur oxidation DsrE/DsrF family protein
MKLALNLLAVVPIENQQVNSIDDFKIVLTYLINKYQLKDYLIVDRYQLSKIGFEHLISEKDYLQLQYQNGIYLDLRNNETVIYDANKVDLIKLNKGKNKVLTNLNRYFNLNFNATLNTLKSSKLLEELQTTRVEFVVCRSFLTKEDLKVKVDYEKMVAEIKTLKREILSMIKKDQDQPIFYLPSFEKVFGFDTN